MPHPPFDVDHDDCLAARFARSLAVEAHRRTYPWSSFVPQVEQAHERERGGRESRRRRHDLAATRLANAHAPAERDRQLAQLGIRSRDFAGSVVLVGPERLLWQVRRMGPTTTLFRSSIDGGEYCEPAAPATRSVLGVVLLAFLNGDGGRGNASVAGQHATRLAPVQHSHQRQPQQRVQCQVKLPLVLGCVVASRQPILAAIVIKWRYQGGKVPQLVSLAARSAAND